MPPRVRTHRFNHPVTGRRGCRPRDPRSQIEAAVRTVRVGLRAEGGGACSPAGTRRNRFRSTSAMRDSTEFGRALAVHPDDEETALAVHEQSMFARAAALEADDDGFCSVMIDDDAPHSLLALMTGATRGRVTRGTARRSSNSRTLPGPVGRVGPLVQLPYGFRGMGAYPPDGSRAHSATQSAAGVQRGLNPTRPAPVLTDTSSVRSAPVCAARCGRGRCRSADATTGRRVPAAVRAAGGGQPGRGRRQRNARWPRGR